MFHHLPKYQLYNLAARVKLAAKLLVVWCLSFPPPMLAQDIFQNPVVVNHLDGLPSDRVLSIAEDQEGFMWIGTDGGLVRYDGTLLEVYVESEEDSTALQSGYIASILPDESTGRVWVANLTGLSSFNPSDKTFKNYRYHPDDPHSIPDFQAHKLFKDKEGDIWIGFKKGGLLRYRPATDDFEHFICENKKVQSDELKCSIDITDIVADIFDEQILWLGTNNGLIKFNKNTGQYELFVYSLENQKRQSQVNEIRCVFPQPNGKIYFGTWWQGVFIFDTANNTFQPLDPCYQNTGREFMRGVSLGFHQKSPHEFWINSTMGTQLYDTRNGCITQTFTNNKNRAFAVDYVDRKGRTWCASRKLGVHIYNPLVQQSTVEIYEPYENRFPAYTTRVLEDKERNKLLVASDLSSGLHIFDRETREWELIPPPADYEMERVGGFRAKDMIFIQKDEVLIVEYNNLYWYKPGFDRLRLYPVQPEAAHQRLQNILKDRDGRYWMFASGHVLRLDLANQSIYAFDKEIKDVWKGRIGGDHMGEDANGNIWMRDLNGLLVYDKSNNKFIYHQHDPKGKPAFRGMGVFETMENGDVWIATNRNSLAYTHADSIEAGILKYFGPADGMKGEIIFSVKLFRDKLLVFSEEGMQVFNPTTKEVEKSYDARYKLDWTLDNFTILSDGTVVAPEMKSIAMFHPDELVVNTEKPVPYISSFHVFDKKWQLKNIPSEPDTVLLSYKQNFFSFEFSSIAYNLPDKIDFQYKLEGFDENWQDGTKRKFAAYTNVPGGDYRFLVKAINNEGIASGEPFAMYLRISTVWWKTNWFWALAFLFLTGCAYLIYKWRISRVRKEERVKAEYERKLAQVEMSALRAQMNPHFIFNSLNSIEFYIITNEQEKAVDYLNRFSRLIRLILQNSKSTIVPLKDDLEALRLYIEMESMRFNNLFDYEVKMESTIDMEEVMIPPMLMQPFVENSIWHGLMQKKDGKGKIDLSLRRSNGHLICLIEDNGIGRDAAQQLRSKSAPKRKSYGMKITSDRLAMLNKLAGANASVNIFDLKNKEGSAEGTRVELVIPI
ncbi:MAG: histidine kinase [Bacteroidota bacterium]